MLTVLKLGGELLEDAAAIATAAFGVQRLAHDGALVVVHGGGRAIDADLKARGVERRFVDGLRITDAATLDSVVAVLAGQINTRVVAALGAAGVQAVGLTGADAQIVRATRANAVISTAGATVDLGLVGRPAIGHAPRLLTDLQALGYVPVIATLGVTDAGEILNVNADVLAAHLAAAMGAARLIVAGSTPGVFDASGATCPSLDAQAARDMVAAGTARDGMVAKLDACLHAIDAGVPAVRIVDGRSGDYAGAPGTTITASTACV